jgi:chromosome partitioning protein
MPITIGVVSQKGGVGKSTIARLLAREFAHNSWEVKIADMDIQQGTSFHWHKQRAANHIEPLIRTEPFSTVAQALKDAPHFDLFILDGAPAATTATQEIARAADVLILPTGLSNDDLRPQVLLAHEFVKQGIPTEKIAFVLCRVGDSDSEIRDARQYITSAGYAVLAGEVPERTLYRRASDSGHAFTETTSKSLNQRADAVVQSIVNAINQITNRRAA